MRSGTEGSWVSYSAAPVKAHTALHYLERKSWLLPLCVTVTKETKCLPKDFTVEVTFKLKGNTSRLTVGAGSQLRHRESRVPPGRRLWSEPLGKRWSLQAAESLVCSPWASLWGRGMQRHLGEKGKHQSQRPFTLAESHWNHTWKTVLCFLKHWLLGPVPGNSDLIGLGYDLGIGIFQEHG